jgi:hypothetical protein
MRDFTRLSGRLQYIQSFENENVWLVNHLFHVGNDVVTKMRVNRGRNVGGASFNFGKEPQQAALIVALGKTFPVHETAFRKNAIRLQEPVSGDQVYLGMIGPAGEASPQHARKCALSYRHAAGDANDVRNTPMSGNSQKLATGDVQVLDSSHMEVQEPRKRDNDFFHFLEGHLFVDAAQRG